MNIIIKEFKDHNSKPYKLKYIYYDEGELEKAIKKMPDYECWDNKKKVLIKKI